jgi:hypothetical protein
MHPLKTYFLFFDCGAYISTKLGDLLGVNVGKYSTWMNMCN